MIHGECLLGHKPLLSKSPCISVSSQERFFISFSFIEKLRIERVYHVFQYQIAGKELG